MGGPEPLLKLAWSPGCSALAAGGCPPGQPRFSMRCCWWEAGCQRRPPANSESWPDPLDCLVRLQEPGGAFRRQPALVALGAPPASISTCSGVVPRPQRPADQGSAVQLESSPAHACAQPHLRAAPAGGDRSQGCATRGNHNGRRFAGCSCWRAPRRHHRSSCLVATGLA